MASQWLFSLPALSLTPSALLLEKEFYDRARGVEFSVSSGLLSCLSVLIIVQSAYHLTHVPSYVGNVYSCHLVPPLLHAVFYGRFSPSGTSILNCIGHLFIRNQDVAASCIFLATKTEECGRKLRDVARVYQAKVKNVDVPQYR